MKHLKISKILSMFLALSMIFSTASVSALAAPKGVGRSPKRMIERMEVIKEAEKLGASTTKSFPADLLTFGYNFNHEDDPRTPASVEIRASIHSYTDAAKDFADDAMSDTKSTLLRYTWFISDDTAPDGWKIIEGKKYQMPSDGLADSFTPGYDIVGKKIKARVEAVGYEGYKEAPPLEVYDATAPEPESYIDLDEAHFPDANLRAFLQVNFAKKDSTKLYQSELDGVTSFNAQKSITDYTGMEYFTKIQTFTISGTNVTSGTVNLSKFPDLKVLNASNCNLSSLDLSKNEKLETLSVSDNKLTAINLSNNPLLRFIDIGHNKLTEINVKNNKNLTMLNVGFNNINTLDLSANTALTELVCYDTQIAGLDLSNTKVTDPEKLHSSSTIIVDDGAPVSSVIGFDSSKVLTVKGGNFNDGKINFDSDKQYINYTYNTGDGKVAGSFTFRLNPLIKELHVQIQAPAAGVSPMYLPVLSDRRCWLDSIEWYDVTDGSEIKQTKAFIEGRKYRVKFNFSPAHTDYDFEEDESKFTVTVNGADPENLVSISGESAYLGFAYTFPAAPLPESGFEFTQQPVDLSDTAGTSLEYSFAVNKKPDVIQLLRIDGSSYIYVNDINIDGLKLNETVTGFVYSDVPKTEEYCIYARYNGTWYYSNPFTAAWTNKVLDGSEIMSVSITGLDVPVMASKPDFNLVIPENAPYHIATADDMKFLTKYGKSAVEWKDIAANKNLTAKDKFNNPAAENYTAKIILVTNTGYKFSDSITAEINKKAELVDTAKSKVVESNDIYVIETTKFTALANGNAILTLDINGGSKEPGFVQTIKTNIGSSLIINDPSEHFVKAPTGQKFAGVEIKGVKYPAGAEYMVTEDATIKFLWNDFEEINKVSVFGFTLPVKNSKPDLKLFLPDDAPYHIATAEEMNFLTKYGKSAVEWKDIGSDKILAADDTFDKTIEKNYTAKIILVGNSGYNFSDTVAADINKNAEIIDKVKSKTEESNGVFVIETLGLTAAEPDPVNVTYNGNGGTIVMGTSVVISQRNSTLLVALDPTVAKAPEGKEFAGMEINGVEYGVGSTYSINGDTSIKLLWKAEGSAVEDIGLINITVTTPPEKGKSYDTVKLSVPSGANYNIYSGEVMAWLTGDTLAGAAPFSGNFEAGKTYWANVKIDVNNAATHKFADNVSVMLKGKGNLTKHTVSTDKSYAELIIKFTIPADAVVTDHNITIKTDGNGTASANVKKAKKDTLITITAAPSSGYKFTRWVVTDGGAVLDNAKSAKTSFTMPDNDVTVKAEFEKVSKPSSSGSGNHPSKIKEENDHWKAVNKEIENAGKNEVVKVDAGSFTKMTWEVMEALKNNPTVSLVISWDGGDDIIIPAGRTLPIEASRVYYSLYNLEDLYKDVKLDNNVKPSSPIPNPPTGAYLF